ncbi:MAG: hypothetical protein HKM04_00730 [Legionellales bacterium]|nr:hypothetical protein [Legionellales bacterium]
MLKRITIALGLLGCSALAFAGAPGNSMVAPLPTGVDLEAPDSLGAWSFGITALYVQPIGGDLQYAQIVDGNAISNKSVQPGNAWGGEADITYHFAGTSRDVSLGYTHLDSDSTAKSGIGHLETIDEGFLFGGEELSSDPDVAKGEMDQDYNSADLTFGQQLLVGNRLVLHPFIGVRYADISTDNKIKYSSSVNSADTGVGRIDSDFQGAGPRAGIDVRVLSGCGLSVVGTFGGALLVGSEDAHASITPSVVAGGAPTDWKNDDSVNLVPELDARIGLDYTPHQLFPAGSMGFQVGYEVVHYFNASDIDNLDTTLVNSVNNQSSFSYQGPYFRLQLNIA